MAKTSLTFLKYFFPISLIVILISLPLEEGHGLERGKAITSYYHSVQIGSLLPAPVCNPSTKGTNKKASLKVVNKLGPCSHYSQLHKPTFKQVLISDQSRTSFIQSRHALNASLLYSRVNLPARFHDLEYIVTIGIGTPKTYLSLIIDTGSDFTWAKCKPTAIFDPSKSTTYSNVTCKSPACSKLVSATSNSAGCLNSTCTFIVQYADGSYSNGFLGKDKLTLKRKDVFPKFLFGCSEDSKGGAASNSDGLLGLGRNPLSVLSQTAKKYRKFFFYCLPTMASSDGYLTFGKKRGVSRNVKFTRLLKNQQFYYVKILAIFVRGRKLPIKPWVFKKAGTIVDSGTVVTRLPPKAYGALRTAFRREMKKYKMTPPFEILDTCYNFSKVSFVTMPRIRFQFDGNVKVDIHPRGILVNVNVSQFCLAFAGNSDPYDVSIFGNLQQQTLELVYDVNGRKLGFRHGGCS